MMLNIKELTQKGSPVTLTGTFNLDQAFAGDNGIEVLGKMEAELTAHSLRGLVEVEGTLQLPLRMSCSRCLKPVEEKLVVPFKERFASRADAIPEEDQDEVHLIAEDHIKLEPYVEEAVWLAVPLAPLCSEDCNGLCPECGSNLNDGPCGCNHQKIDPRLMGLADFFNRNDT